MHSSLEIQHKTKASAIDDPIGGTAESIAIVLQNPDRTVDKWHQFSVLPVVFFLYEEYKLDRHILNAFDGGILRRWRNWKKNKKRSSVKLYLNARSFNQYGNMWSITLWYKLLSPFGIIIAYKFNWMLSRSRQREMEERDRKREREKEIIRGSYKKQSHLWWKSDFLSLSGKMAGAILLESKIIGMM